MLLVNPPPPKQRHPIALAWAEDCGSIQLMVLGPIGIQLTALNSRIFGDPESILKPSGKAVMLVVSLSFVRPTKKLVGARRLATLRPPS